MDRKIDESECIFRWNWKRIPIVPKTMTMPFFYIKGMDLSFENERQRKENSTKINSSRNKLISQNCMQSRMNGIQNEIWWQISISNTDFWVVFAILFALCWCMVCSRLVSTYNEQRASSASSSSKRSDWGREQELWCWSEWMIICTSNGRNDYFITEKGTVSYVQKRDP